MNTSTRKVEEITVEDYLKYHGQVDTMVVEVGEDRKRKISLDAVECSLSDLLNFLSKVK